MSYQFGRDIPYTFYPTDEDGVSISGIPAQTATLYLYTSKPSAAQVLAGTGSTSSTTASWTANATSCTFTISAVTDPNPGGAPTEYRYWVGIKLILKTAGDSQAVIREIIFERVEGQAKAVTVTSTNLTNIYPAATSYATSGQIAAQITAATDYLRAKLRAKGFEWALITRLDRMDNIVTLMSLSQIMRSQVQEAGDHFYQLYKDFGEQAQTLLDSLQFEYDEYESGGATTEETSQTFGIIPR